MPAKNKRQVKKANELELSQSLKESFVRFIEYHPSDRFSRNLRKMILEFLQHDGAIEAIYLNDLFYDLEGLFSLLDAIQDENIEPA